MAFSTAQLETMVEKVKRYMRIGDDDEQFLQDGLACFCSASDANSATVQVTDTTWVGVITGGGSAGTTTKTFANASDDTLGELASTINAVSGWTANLVGNSDADSTLLVRLAATNALAQDNELTLRFENEAILELLITNGLKMIETAICRDLITTSYTEEYFLNGDNQIILENPKVTAVTQVAYEQEDGLTVEYTGSDESARVEVTDAAVKTISRTGATTTTTTSTFASNVTTTAMASTINGLSGWSASVVNARPAGFLMRRGARNAKGTSVTLEVWDDSDSEYEVDYDAGIILLDHRTQAENGKAYVAYDAGYTDIPADLEQVLLEMVKAGFDASGIGAGLKSERLGDYAYTVADNQDSEMASFLDTQAPILARYARWQP